MPLPTTSLFETEILSVPLPSLPQDINGDLPYIPQLDKAVKLLSSDEVIAIPTETVYGLAGNALSSIAVAKIFAAKGRPSDNPLIVHVANLDQLKSLLPDGKELPKAYAEAVQFWPGPLTLILPRHPSLPDSISAGQPTVAVRLPSHPIARALIAQCGFPLAAPSANLSGRPSPTTAAHVFVDLSGRIPMIIDGGPCNVGVESTVLDALSSPPAILRPGGITFEQLVQCKGLEDLRVYKRDFVDKELEEAPTTPGMKYRHYSPNAKVILLEPSSANGTTEYTAESMNARNCILLNQIRELGDSGIRRVVILRSFVPSQFPPLVVEVGEVQVWIHELGNTNEAVARELFSGLRKADEQGAEVILVEGVVDEASGMAVMNRLRKAASTIITQ